MLWSKIATYMDTSAHPQVNQACIPILTHLGKIAMLRIGSKPPIEQICQWEYNVTQLNKFLSDVVIVKDDVWISNQFLSNTNFLILLC